MKIDIDGFRFEFGDSILYCRIGSSAFYKKAQSLCGGMKEVDLMLYDPSTCELWFIEVKDYSAHSRTKPAKVQDEIAAKIRDSCAILLAAGANDVAGSSPAQIREFWQKARMFKAIRVALHLELPSRPSRLFPGVKDQANILQNLRKSVRPWHSHPVVVSTGTMERLKADKKIAWTVRR